MVAKPPIARTHRKTIRYITTVKMLIKGIQNCIRCMRESPIPLEEVCSNLGEMGGSPLHQGPPDDLQMSLHR
jgi:hypothetical protein